MDTEKIWNDGEWTEDARQIIDGLKEFPDNSKIILILRHSHRNEPTALETAQKLRLTPQGHAIAEKFGEGLPISRTIRLFHSVIWRCEETAVNIHNGFKKIGGESEFLEIFEPLHNMGINNRVVLKKFKNYKFREIMYLWAVGFFHSKDWEPFISYCQNTAQLISKHLKDAPEKGINIYITHDWHLMSLRFGWFGLPPDLQWVKFLGGFAFIFEDDHFLLLERDELKSVQAPHWWKSNF